MNLRNFLFTILGIAAFGWLFGYSPEPARASLQSCNPTIASISGTSTVWGRTRNMSVPGPGTETTSRPPSVTQQLSSSGANDVTTNNFITQLPAGTFQSLETVQGGGLEVTTGMSYRGNGLWQDDRGNRLQLTIQATRTNNSTGGVSGFPSPCAGTLQGPNSPLVGIPGGFGPNSTTAEIIGNWCIVNSQPASGGCGQSFGLRALVFVTAIPEPSAPPPTTPPAAQAPVLSVTNTCSGTSSVFNLSWTAVPTNGYALFQNNAQYATVPANQLSTTTAAANPGSAFTYRVEAINTSGRVASNSVGPLTARDCAPTPPPVTPPPSPSAPGPFTVSATTSCLNANTIQVNLSWTTSSGASIYHLYAVENSSAQILTSTASTSYQYTEPAGARTIRYYNLNTGGVGGTTFATPGRGTAAASPDGSWFRFSVALPDCAPTPPGIFTANIVTSCSGTNPVGVLSWTAASGATSYRIYDTGTPGATTDLGTLISSDPRTFNVALTRANPRFSVDALNAGGINSASVTAQLPDCTPDPSITLAAINTTCSAGIPHNLLSWTSDNGTGGTLGDYIILRDGVTLGTLTGTTYTDTGATQGATYTYTIQSGTTISNAQSVTTQTCPQAPGPLTLSATSECVGTTPINRLSWTPSSAATRYQVLRDGQAQPLANIDAPTVTYTDSAVAAGESHGYIIRAINNVGSRDSANQQLSTLNCTPAVVNNPPVANDDSVTTGPATAVTVPVLDNDSDPDGNLDPTTVRITQNPSNGSATNSSGSIIYTPNAGFAGIDTLTYEVCDTTALCDTAVVTITVTAAPPPPPPPVLPGPLTLSTQAVCVGQAPQNVLTWTVATNTNSYTVKRNNQTVTTTTTTNYIDTTAVTGTTYTYTIDATNSAGTTTSNAAPASTLNCVPAVNLLPPVASDDTATTQQNSFVVIDVLANDVDSDGQVDPSCTRVLTQPAHGTTTVDTTNGRISYTPTIDFNGTDSFVYEMCDNNGLTDTATVTINVLPPPPTPQPANTPPQANDDTATTLHNQPVNIDILLNDSDPDGNLDIACTKVSRQPDHGTVSIDTTTHRATYTPTNGFAGTDTFEYSICDTTGASDTATVSIAVGQAPPAALASTGIPIFGFFVDLWNQFLSFLGLR